MYNKANYSETSGAQKIYEKIAIMSSCRNFQNRTSYIQYDFLKINYCILIATEF
jgi:hypothetical protein